MGNVESNKLAHACSFVVPSSSSDTGSSSINERKIMKPGTIGLTAIITIATATAGLQGRAADVPPPAPFLTLNAGGNFLTGTTITDQNGVTTKPKSDTGWRADLTLGFAPSRWFAVEAEIGFMRNTFQHSSNWYQAIPAPVSAVFRFENSTGFVPYIGAGAGAAWTMVGVGGLHETECVLAYQGKAGVAYKIRPDMMIDISYKFLTTARQNYSDIGVELSHPYASYFGLSFTWMF